MGKAAQPGADGQVRDHVERVPFLMLALDLPPAPLYKDALDKDIIPQVAVSTNAWQDTADAWAVLQLIVACSASAHHGWRDFCSTDWSSLN